MRTREMRGRIARAQAAVVIFALTASLFGSHGPLVESAQVDLEGQVGISEIRIDQPSDDLDEYFELAGPAGTLLDGLTYLVIGDGTGGSGVIEAVVDLTDQAIPASGYFVAAESTFALGAADLVTNLNFENSDNVTHLLVRDFTGANGADLDTDDDGVLDVTPWAALVDLIALVEEPNPPSATEYHYGPPSVGPDGYYVPGHVYVCDESWMIGPFDPVGGEDTPGAVNACPVATEVGISEIRIDQPSDDLDEYFELAGPAGTPLDGLTYLVIGDGTGGSGVIEAVVDLTGQAIPASGYFVAAESTFALGAADLVTNLNFENSDNVTHLLVRDFSGADGDDLDADDDGVLDVTPWTVLVDLIALVESDPPVYTEHHYGPPSVGPDGYYVPGHVYVCDESWMIGPFDPVGGEDTPGAVNACPVATEVGISEIRIDQPSDDLDEYFELAGPAGTPLDGLTYLVIGDGTGGSGVIEAVVDLTGQAIPASGYFVAAESTFALGAADLVTNLNFENSDNVTHLLVGNFSGADGDDLDADDDGVLDVTPWTVLIDLIALVESDPPVYTEHHYGPPSVGPDGYYVPGHAFVCYGEWVIGAFDTGVGDDTPGGANDCFRQCGDPAVFVHEVQGSGSSSPIDGASGVTIEGVVVGDFQTGSSLSGFFLQEEDGDADIDPTTSEGIFVYDGYYPAVDVHVGEVVRVMGTVDEYYNLTELTSVTDIVICGTGGETTAAEITLPVEDLDVWEQYEGMLVTMPQELYVTENYNLGRYGQVHLSPGDRLYNPTNVVLPGTPANELQALNDRSRVILDDLSNVQNPDPIIHPPPELSADNTLRSGYSVSNLTGVLDYSYSEYKLRPVDDVMFTAANERTAAPDPVDSEEGFSAAVKVASFNVLNYFTTLDTGAPICGPDGDMDCRGAESEEEFIRQRDKIINAIVAMDADVVGLIEIENPRDGEPDYAVEDLVSGLNDAAGAGTYAFIGTGDIGTDAIKQAFVYKPGEVTPVGSYAILDSSVDPTFLDTKNRPALAQTFQHETGEIFTVVVNHLKSKGSSCSDVGDPDLGDGQGNCNLTRTAAATALVNWLATDPTGSGDPDFLVIGDLNAYAMEDPITALKDGDYVDLVNSYVGPDAYSYVFEGQSGYLDHALANASMVEHVTGVTIWHVNADEPSVLDYNTNYKSGDQIESLYSPEPYRASDHDPVIVGFCDAVPPVVNVQVTPEVLWPPNHKYVDVQALVDVSDPTGGVTVDLLSVESNEADDGLGDGDTPDDIVIVNDFSFQLRAEVSGLNGDRIYTVTYLVTDGCGNSTVATATVTVPHDQRVVK